MQQPTVPPELLDLLPSLGSGVVGGFAIGWAARKLLRLVVFLLVVQFGVLVVLEQLGYIVINYDRFRRLWVDIDPSRVPDDVPVQIEVLPFSAAFVGGFVLGFRRG